MGMFDFLTGNTDPLVGSPAPNTQGNLGGGVGKLFTDPNFIQLLAGMGSGFSQGKGAGEAIGGPTAEMMRNQQAQKSGSALLEAILNPKNREGMVTPVGSPGADKIVTSQDANGQTITIKSPSEKNLNTFGTTVPPESQPAQAAQSMQSSSMGGSQEQSPFWKALLR